MFFSIIIPVYNVEKYLDDCIRSVTEQDFKNYEIIIVDDGSTDSSRKISDLWEAIMRFGIYRLRLFIRKIRDWMVQEILP